MRVSGSARHGAAQVLHQFADPGTSGELLADVRELKSWPRLVHTVKVAVTRHCAAEKRRPLVQL
jgi:FlaA1/EpsC-like NDP-sugar epimerase